MPRKWLARIGLPACLLLGVSVGSLSLFAQGRERQPVARWEYKVSTFSFNPGERLSEEARARAYERTLNTFSAEGWEYVGPVLTRDNVQTVGGAITTRDTVSFVAFRRPKS